MAGSGRAIWAPSTNTDTSACSAGVSGDLAATGAALQDAVAEIACELVQDLDRLHAALAMADQHRHRELRRQQAEHQASRQNVGASKRILCHDGSSSVGVITSRGRQSGWRGAVCVILSIEAESVRTQIGRKRSTFGLGGLPGLVFRPAVEVGDAELRCGSLLRLRKLDAGYDPRDRIALGILTELFRERQVVGIHAVDLVWGLGTLHCLTQQQPAGR